MSAFTKAVTVSLITGMFCFCFGGKAPAMELDLEEKKGEPGEVPAYYRQLQEFAAEKGRDEESRRPKILEYIIEPADCLYAIAERFGTDVDTLVQLNDIANPSLIYPGDRLEILNVIGCVHDVEEGDTVAAIAAAYGVDETAIREANELKDPPVLSRGERIIVPGGAASRSSSRISFCWPLKSRISSGYGWRGDKFHYGIDIAAPLGTAFCAAAGGRVTHSGYRGSYGIMIELDHGGGYFSRYGHASRAEVAVGQRVSAGQTIGHIGMTGNTTGPHLHFEIHAAGEKVNPLNYLH